MSRECPGCGQAIKAYGPAWCADCIAQAAAKRVTPVYVTITCACGNEFSALAGTKSCPTCKTTQSNRAARAEYRLSESEQRHNIERANEIDRRMED